MNFEFSFYVKTDIGIQRSRNEDCYGICDVHELCLVADGMGGHLGGDIAARLAIDTIFDYFQQTVENNTNNSNYDKDKEVITKAFQKANTTVFTKGNSNQNLRDMGTTVVGTWLRKDYAVLASVGDSRIYMLRDNKLKQLTNDHSWVAELVSKNLLPPEEAANHPLKNIITRAIGIEKKVAVDTFKQKLISGDIYLLCTDGLTDYVEDFRIKEIIEDNIDNLETALDKLIELANFIAGADNITIALIKVEKVDSDSNNGDNGRRRKSNIQKPPETTITTTKNS